MAFTEKYVTTTGAGARDGSSEANAWSFADMIDAAPAAETRVNIKAGSYSAGATTLPANGTFLQPIVLRGYSSSIGDLDDQGRSADGTLDTANMPDFAITAAWTPSSYCYLQNLDIVNNGNINSALLSSSSVDEVSLISCRFTNTTNNSSAACVLNDNNLTAENCDFRCTGAAHGIIVNCDNTCYFVGCRFTGTDTSAIFLQLDHGIVSDCVFPGVGGTSIAIYFSATTLATRFIAHNTIYNFATAIQSWNTAANSPLILHQNHITDCGKLLDNLYSATSHQPVYETWNRVRDNTTPRTGILSIALAGEVDTDSGDYTTDYVSSTNLRLKSTAAGSRAGMMPYTDIGAHGVAAPTIPAAEDVENGVTYGYADNELTGTLAASGGGGGAILLGSSGRFGVHEV